MKVLLIHNFYKSSSPSGEDVVFKNETALLEGKGIQVITYEKFNDNIRKGLDKIKIAFNVIWSSTVYRQIKTIIKKEKPDLAHFHNIWYLISPSAYYACKDLNVPVVQTLHNFRIFCANGLLLKKGKICEACLKNFPYKGTLYGCYKNSRLYSMPISLTQIVHSIIGTWNNKINAFICPSEFVKNKIIQFGLPAEKIFVKPNFIPNPPEPCFFNEDYIVFLGRLSREKGPEILIDAYSKIHSTTGNNPSLKIIGEGPLRKSLEDNIKIEKIANVEFLGRMDINKSMEIMKKSKFLVIPSLCYETFSLAAIEAFACGKPVIASRLGALAEIIQDKKTGLLFEPGNPQDLALKIKWLNENKDVCIEMGKNARKEFEQKYNADKNYEILMAIYKKTLGISN